jgi:NAD+ diphosphatase
MNPDYKFCPRCASPLEVLPLGGRQRTACTACGFTHWNNPLPVVAAIIEYQGQIVLARNAAWPPKVFALITGFLEAGETPEQGIAREVEEETSLVVTQVSLVGVYEFTRKNELIIAYHVQAEGEIKLSEELVDYKLVAPADLRPWKMGTGLALADWMRARNLPFEFLERP